MFNWLKEKLSSKDPFKTDKKIYMIDVKGKLQELCSENIAYIEDVQPCEKIGEIIIFTKRLYLKDRTNFDFKVDKVHGWWDRYRKK